MREGFLGLGGPQHVLVAPSKHRGSVWQSGTLAFPERVFIWPHMGIVGREGGGGGRGGGERRPWNSQRCHKFHPSSSLCSENHSRIINYGERNAGTFL